MPSIRHSRQEISKSQPRFHLMFLDKRIQYRLFFLVILLVPHFKLVGQEQDRSDTKASAKLQVINGSKNPVRVFWLKTDDERVFNVEIKPGRDSIINTTIGHRFMIERSRPSVGDTPDASAEKSQSLQVTSLVPVQAIRIDESDPDGIPEFYTQRIKAQGYPIVGSKNVNPYALQEAAYLVDLMLAQRPDVRQAMIQSGSRLCVLAYNEFTTEQPEFARMADRPLRQFPGVSAKDYWDARARGMGGSLRDPFCSCAEENLLGYPGDPYSTECILIHEIAHNIHLRGMVNIDPTFDSRLKATHKAAMDEGLWKGKYASVNHHEYFAEGVQSWFDNNRENDHDHNHVNTRSELREYDPRLAAMCKEVFGETQLRYTKPVTRIKGHLKGYRPEDAPRFRWPKRLSTAQKKIRETAQKRSGN